METIRKEYNFINPTLKFCIAGLFIPGFTAMIIVGLQIGIEFFGIECSKSWTVLWVFSTIIAVIAPVIFLQLMNKNLIKGYNLTLDKLIVFNVIEYTFLQCSLAILFTDGKTLCYGNGGQNGIEFVFTGWLALPFIIALSWVLDNLREQKTEEIKAAKLSK